MFINEVLPFVTNFVYDLNEALKEIDPKAGLSRIQKGWLGFCIGAIVVTNSVCWKRFERAGWGCCSHAGLSWMFRRTKILWQSLLCASVEVILHWF